MAGKFLHVSSSAKVLNMQQATTRFVSHGARALMPAPPGPLTWTSADGLFPVDHAGVPDQYQVDHYFELHVRRSLHACFSATLILTASSCST